MLTILHVPYGLWGDKEGYFKPRTKDACMIPLRRLLQLEDVDLSAVYTLTNTGLQALGQVPGLKRLYLRNLGSQVTGDGLRNLLQGPSPLHRIDCSKCLSHGPGRTGRTRITQEEVVGLRARFPGVAIVIS